MLSQIVLPGQRMQQAVVAGARVVRPYVAWLARPALHEGMLVAAIGALVFFWRLAWLEPVEIGGDALKVWEFARQLLHGGDLPARLNHHLVRFGLVAPTWLAQLCFGSDAWVYYVAPLAAGVLLHLSVYGLARKLSGRFGGILAVALLLGFGEMVRPSSQILPELFGPAYVSAAYLAVLFYTDATSRRAQLLWLGVAALLLFAAYGSKVSFLYYAPGAALLVWRAEVRRRSDGGVLESGAPDAAPEKGAGRGRAARIATRVWRWVEARGMKDACLLTLFVLGMLALETGLYQVFTSYSGQLAVINKTHGMGRSQEIKNVARFFDIYRNAGVEWHRWFLGGSLATLGVCAVARDRRAPLLMAALILFALLHTFVLRKLNPPIPWIKPHPRYLLALAPLLAVAGGVFVHEAFVAVANRSFLKGTPVLRRLLAALASSALLLALAQELHTDWEKQWNGRHAFRTAERTQAAFTEAFAAGIPLVTRVSTGKPLRIAVGLYIEPRLLMVDGKLQGYDAFRGRASKNLLYVLREPGRTKEERRRINAEVKRRTQKRKCAMVLGQRYRFLTGSVRVPRGCEALGVGG